MPTTRTLTVAQRGFLRMGYVNYKPQAKLSDIHSSVLAELKAMGYGMEITRRSVQSEVGGDYGVASSHFQITLTKGQSVMTTEYHQGAAYTTFREECAVVQLPTLADVMSCVVADASCFLEYGDLDEFAESLGYSKPSLAAAAYDACQRSWRFLQSDLEQLQELFQDW